MASGENIYSPSWAGEDSIFRPVALIGRASDSKSEGWGFESLLACINLFEGYVFKSSRVSGGSEGRGEKSNVAYSSGGYEWDCCSRIRGFGDGYVSGNC